MIFFYIWILQIFPLNCDYNYIPSTQALPVCDINIVRYQGTENLQSRGPPLRFIPHKRVQSKELTPDNINASKHTKKGACSMNGTYTIPQSIPSPSFDSAALPKDVQFSDFDSAYLPYFALLDDYTRRAKKKAKKKKAKKKAKKAKKKAEQAKIDARNQMIFQCGLDTVQKVALMAAERKFSKS